MFRLNPIEEKDLALVFKWRNTKNIRDCMLQDQLITWQEHCNWFENLKSRNDRAFFLFYIQENPVGIISFADINVDRQDCSWGFYIGDSTAPRGAGSLMAFYGIEYMFTTYCLYKINSQVVAFNEASLRFHKSLKFKTIGSLKDTLYRENKHYDLILFSLLKDEWNNEKEIIYGNALKRLKGEG